MPLDPSIVKRNSNEFSVTKEAISEANNTDFIAGAQDFYNVIDQNLPDTKESYVWTAMSAVADDIGEVLYEKVLNYIDDVCDIDTCSIKALKSMAQALGTEHSAFKTIQDAPLEILDLLDVFTIRKDYLLNSKKVCAQLEQKLNKPIRDPRYRIYGVIDNICSALGGDILSSLNCEDVRPSAFFEQLSAADFIQISALDSVIQSTYYDVLMSNISQKYNTISNEVIYEVLSNEILCSDFAIPNKYSEDIYAAKVRWNIPVEFDPSAEADKIDSGISSRDSYSQYEQKLLDIEYKRRSDPRNDLENRSRYSYYKEAKVRDYFRFVEKEYSLARSSYSAAAEYALDPNYLEIIGLQAQRPLLTVGNDGKPKLDTSMVTEVAKQLLDVTNAIRGIREYLKSQAQRNYMKGTYLLIAYAINEYLKNNVYPALKKLNIDTSSFPLSQNQLTLTEYIDQTDYNNIETDIKEDVGKHDLNPQFWLGTGAEGNADSLDTTNIFRPEDKAKVNSVRTFTQDQIADFYLNVLGSFKNIDKLRASDVNGTLAKFLSAVFSVGADNTWLDEHGKVMCELPNTTVTTSADEYLKGRKFTVDQDYYVYDVKEAFDSSQCVLSGFEPIENTTVQSQLDDALAAFKSKSQDTYSADLDAALARVQSTIDDTQARINDFSQFDETFSSITTQYSNLTASYLQYTGDFAASTSEYFAKQLAHYSDLVTHVFTFKSQNIRDTLQVQIAQVETQYNALMFEVQTMVSSYVLSSDLTAHYQLSDNPLKLDVYLTYMTAKLKDVIRADTEQSYLYEFVRAAAIDALLKAQATLLTKKLLVQSNGQDAINQHLKRTQYEEFDQLSLLLSSHYQDVFNILSCVEVLSSMLDYEDTSWYQYKKALFSKYIGLSIGETPYYYLENTIHPSYQIHPCLSNFIENLDFSYPVKGLAGIAQSTIEYIVKNNTTVRIDSNGYLLSVWNNPLNGNGDYLTRYEKADHTDALNNDNCLYGYDGPFYIGATNEEQMGKALASLNSQTTLNNSWYRGLNITDVERKQILAKLTKFGKHIKDIAKDASTHIIRYGLDAYENSYTLMSSSTTASGASVLWMRKKNHPYAFPALAFKQSAGEYVPDNSFSQIQFDSSVSNSFFSQVKMAQIGEHWFPIIRDFIFSKDKTTAIFLCESTDGTVYWPIHAVVTQKYVRNETYDSYIQHFEFDKDTGTEHCLSANIDDCQLTSFYVRDNDVGILYAKKTGQIDSLDIMIDTYLRGDRGKYQDSIASGRVKSGALVKLDVQKDGSFSLAYVGDASPGTFTTYEKFNGLAYNGAVLQKYVDVHDKVLKSCDYQVIGSTIVEKNARDYLPYVEMGFIPLFRIPNSNNSTYLNGTSLQDDLDNGKPMKFEMFCDAADSSQGIDFKFICPIRSFEASYASYADESYHRDTTIGLKRYAFTDMHYLESQYNKYVLEYDDPTFWDHTEAERDSYLSSRNAEHDVFDDYMKLARYDVQQYLSVLRDEDGTPTYSQGLEGTVEQISPEEMSQVAEPFLVSWTDIQSGKLETYVRGYYAGSRTIAQGQVTIKMKDSDLKVTWMKNDIGTIKLDFNAQHYKTTVSSIQKSNVRNCKHLFLNLDRPGDSGYLIIYKNGTAGILYKLFIKNISDTTRPRFVMKKLNIDRTQNTSNLVGVTASAFKARQGEIDVPILAEEGFASKYIVFE